MVEIKIYLDPRMSELFGLISKEAGLVVHALNRNALKFRFF